MFSLCIIILSLVIIRCTAWSHSSPLLNGFPQVTFHHIGITHGSSFSKKLHLPSVSMLKASYVATEEKQTLNENSFTNFMIGAHSNSSRLSYIAIRFKNCVRATFMTHNLIQTSYNKLNKKKQISVRLNSYKYLRITNRRKG